MGNFPTMDAYCKIGDFALVERDSPLNKPNALLAYAEVNHRVPFIPRNLRPLVTMRPKLTTAAITTGDISIADKLRDVLTPEVEDDLRLPFPLRHLQDLQKGLTEKLQKCKEITELIYGYPEHNQEWAYPLPGTEDEFDREMRFWLSCDIDKIRSCFDRATLGERERAFEKGVCKDNEELFRAFVTFKYNELMEHGNGSLISHYISDKQNIFTQREMCLIDMVEPRLYDKIIIASNRYIEARHSSFQLESKMVAMEYHKEFRALHEFKNIFQPECEKASGQISWRLIRLDTDARI